MNRVKKVLKYILDSDYRFMVNAYKGLYNNWPDEKYLKKMCDVRLGYKLNLENPRTFNEKLQWLKLHNRKSEYMT